MSIIEPSRYDAGTAYVAANRYQQDDFRPYLLRTTDYGRTWTRIDAGIPVGAYTRAIREDPVRRGLLYAGTETGVYVSFDDGARWEPLQLNLPRVSVRDLAVKDDALVAATHGRSFWVLDGLAPLRQLSAAVRAKPVHLFTPAPAIRYTPGRSRRDGEVGENPPAGVLVDYWLPTAPAGAVRLEFLDSTGAVLRTFAGREAGRGGATARPAYTAADSLARGTAYDTTGQGTTRRRADADSLAWFPADSLPHARAGLNRFVWDLRLAGIRELEQVVNDEGTDAGPMLVPGRYAVRLTVGGRTETQPFTVVDDPRMGASPAELAAAFALTRRTVETTNALADAVRRIERLQAQVDARAAQVRGQPAAQRVGDAAHDLRGRLEAVRAELADVHSQRDQITLHYPVKLYNQLLNLNRMAQSFDRAPTTQAEAVWRDLAGKFEAQQARLRAVEAGELAAFNQLLRELGVPAVGEPAATPVAAR
jgi:hypothetical protein